MDRHSRIPPVFSLCCSAAAAAGAPCFLGGVVADGSLIRESGREAGGELPSGMGDARDRCGSTRDRDVDESDTLDVNGTVEKKASDSIKINKQ
jgi:hypothetical protein